MNKCKNCKYYKKYDDKLYEKGFGKCDCEKFLDANDLPWEYKRDKDTLRYWDYECYSCGFDVGEEFGCIHFKKKDNLESEVN